MMKQDFITIIGIIAFILVVFRQGPAKKEIKGGANKEAEKTQFKGK